MRGTKFATIAVVAVAITALLAACGSSAPDAATSPTVAPTGAPTAAPTDVPAVEVDASGAATDETVDDRSPEEVALDQLDLMVYQLTSADLIEVSDCVVERLESEGIPLTGQGSPELVALVGCEPGVIDRLIGLNPEAAPPETRACVINAIGEWIAALPLTEASTFFEAASPPAALTTDIAAACEITEDLVNALLN